MTESLQQYVKHLAQEYEIPQKDLIIDGKFNRTRQRHSVELLLKPTGSMNTYSDNILQENSDVSAERMERTCRDSLQYLEDKYHKDENVVYYKGKAFFFEYLAYAENYVSIELECPRCAAVHSTDVHNTDYTMCHLDTMMLYTLPHALSDCTCKTERLK